MKKAFGRTVLALVLTCGIAPAKAWDRGHTETFAVLPTLPGNMPVASEGLTVGPDGTVYTPSFGVNSQGAVPGPPHLFSFWPNGQLRYNVALVNPLPSPAPQPSTVLLGLVFQASSKNLLICDLAQGIVWQTNPATGTSTVFTDTGQGSNSGLNALTFDKAGNVYVSDSFLGVIWQTGPNGGPPSVFVNSQTLSPQAATGVILVPPFGCRPGCGWNSRWRSLRVLKPKGSRRSRVGVETTP
jgi:hypothetical protein